MAQLAFPPGFRVLDTNGDPLSGAKLFFYDAGTTDDRTVYTESTLTTAHAQPVVCDSGGQVPAIYVPEGLYRVKGFTSADVTIAGFDHDNISGPIDTSALTTTEAKPITTVSSITSTTTLTSSAAGTVVNANPGGGSFTVTLPAASIGNGKKIEIRNIGETGTVTVSGGASTIDGASTRTLDRQYQSEIFTSDGSDWHVTDGVKVIKPITLTLTDAANISWDLRDGNDATVTLTANRTLDAPDNPLIGQEGTLIVVQDGFGAHTLTFNSIFKFEGGVTQQPSEVADERTMYRYKVISLTEIFISREWVEGRNRIGLFKEYDLGAVTIGSSTTQAHGLGRFPSLTIAYFENVTADLGYTTGQRIVFCSDTGDSTSTGLAVAEDTTSVFVHVATISLPVIRADTNARAAITIANWKLIIRVYE